MKKNYVLDSNVLINDPLCMFKFDDNDVTIPLIVLEEIDSFKKEESSRAQSSRRINRELDKLRELGSLHEGVELATGGILRVECTCPEPVFTKTINKAYNDNVLLQTFLDMRNRDSEVNYVLVTKDINLRVRADALGIPVEDYQNMKVEDVSFYDEIPVLDFLDEEIDQIYAEQFLYNGEDYGVGCNSYVVLKNQETSKSALAVVNDEGGFNLVRKETAYGLAPKNKEQTFAMDALMDPDIHLVVLTGVAGTGKTILSIAAALEQVIGKKQIYQKMIVSRPVISMGKEMGFLPGPQPLDAKVLTPEGWTTMGEIKPGDEVISRDGSPSKVLGVYPKGVKPVFKIVTDDGSETECCEDHLWFTQSKEEKKRGKAGKVRSTEEIIGSLYNKKGKPNHYLPRNEAVEFTKKDLPIPPYSLGVLLGNGSFSNSISFSSPDEEVIERVQEELSTLGGSLTWVPSQGCWNLNITGDLYNNKTARPVKLTSVNDNTEVVYESIGMAVGDLSCVNRSTVHYRCENQSEVDGIRYEFLEKGKTWQNPVKEPLDNLGLLGKKAWEKFIPSIYKYSSIEDRLDILRGLMDTDGTIKEIGESSFCTSSETLASDIIEIVKSLGGRAVLRERDRREEEGGTIDGREIKSKRISYEFTVSLPQHINPFYVQRKADRHKCSYIYDSKIVAVEQVGEKEVQCILIDNPEHLYLTDDFLVTHNTLEEKMDPWLGPIYDNLDYLTRNSVKAMQGKSGFAHMKDLDLVEVQALSYIRGRSIANSVLIIDECQSLTRHEMKTIITRAGAGTKIICVGDVFQIDNPYLDIHSNGLTYLIDKLKGEKLFAHVHLTKGERSALAELAAEKL